MIHKIDLHELAQRQQQYAREVCAEHNARLKEVHTQLVKEFEIAKTYNEWAYIHNIMTLCRTGK